LLPNPVAVRAGLRETGQPARRNTALGGRALSGGRGGGRIVEVGGPGTLGQAIKAAAIGGHISLVSILETGDMPGFMERSISRATVLLRFVETATFRGRQSLQLHFRQRARTDHLHWAGWILHLLIVRALVSASRVSAIRCTAVTTAIA
jgi:hypothetical protein